MNLKRAKAKAAIAVLDAMYSDILSAVAHAVAKLREIGEEDAALELEDWGRDVERQKRTLEEALHWLHSRTRPRVQRDVEGAR